MTTWSKRPSGGSLRRSRPRRRRGVGIAAVAIIALLALAPSAAAAGPNGKPSAPPDFGPNVLIFDPSMPQSQIQAAVDAIATQQVPNQFGPERYALLFKPGTYGSAANPLNFQVGYYTAVAGLGRSPGDVVINGSVFVRNQCTASGCVALNNFWRSLSNLTINVTTPNFGCYTGEFWAVSQAAPMRRVHVNGQTTLMDYCTGPSFASGGFIADSQFTETSSTDRSSSGSSRNSTIGGWTNGVWNQVFSGVVGAPAQCFPAQARRRPVHDPRDEPGHSRGAVPLRRRRRAVQHLRALGPDELVRNDVGLRADAGPVGRDGGHLRRAPGDNVKDINNALAQGKSIIFTPGIYQTDKTIKVKRADTVVLGLGMATLEPENGVVPMTVANVPGVQISGLIFDAGPVNSPGSARGRHREGQEPLRRR